MQHIQEDGGHYLLTIGFVKAHMEEVESPEALAHLAGLARSALTRRESAFAKGDAAAATAALSELLIYARMASAVMDLKEWLAIVHEADLAQ